MPGDKGGRRPRDKGIRAERELARMLGGQRVPLSGSAGGAFGGDIKAMGLTWQVKVEEDGWRRFYRWLETHDAVAVKADRKPWLFVMPIHIFLKLVKDIREGKDRGKEAG